MGWYGVLSRKDTPEDFPDIDAERLTDEVNKLFKPYLFFKNQKNGRQLWSSCCNKSGFKELGPVMDSRDMYLLYGEHNDEAVCPWCGRTVQLKNASRLGQRKYLLEYHPVIFLSERGGEIFARAYWARKDYQGALDALPLFMLTFAYHFKPGMAIQWCDYYGKWEQSVITPEKYSLKDRKISEPFKEYQKYVSYNVFGWEAIENSSFYQYCQYDAFSHTAPEALHYAAELSTRELDRLIKERDEALKAQAEAERERSETAEELEALNHNYTALAVAAKNLRDTADTAEKAAEKERQEKIARERELKAAQGRLQGLEKENKELKGRPVEVAVQIDEEAVKDAAAKARAEADKEWDNKYKELQKALNAAESRTDEAGEREKEELRAQLEEMRKQLQLSNPQVSTFKAHLETFQQAFLTLLKDLAEAEKAEPKAAVGLKNALRAQLGKNLEALGR